MLEVGGFCDNFIRVTRDWAGFKFSKIVCDEIVAGKLMLQFAADPIIEDERCSDTWCVQKRTS